jgi:VCBS repeat-containing protein
VATATAAPPAPTAAAGAGGIQDVQLAILFSSHRGGVHDSQIYVMNPDGSNQRQVTTTRGHSWAPRAAPDGKRMLFSSVAPGQHNSHEATGGGTSANPGNHDIYLADVDGANIINLTARFNSWDNGWSWSPDGKWIAFASDRDGNWELYKMTADGETIVRLTDHPAADGWPSWTPDSKRIVFASNRAGNWEIYVMDQDGANVQRLTFRPDTYDTFPFISPDGTRIVFSSQIEGRNEGEIYIMNVDGSKVTRLTHTVALNNLPSWCPDGDKIVFVSDRDGDENIWIMNADGSGQKQLTTVKGEDTTPNCAYIRRIGP